MYCVKTCNLKVEGRKIDKLSEKHSMIFCEEVSPGTFYRRIVHFPILDRVIHYQNAKSYEAISSTLNRSEINCTKAKMANQKGRGMSRHDAKNAPQFRGGAKAHGPKTTKILAYRLNKKILKSALASALTYHADRGTLFLIEDKDFSLPKTQEVISFLRNFPVYPATKDMLKINKLDMSMEAQSTEFNLNTFIPLNDDKAPGKREYTKSLFVGQNKENQKNTLAAVQNLKGVDFIPAIGLNVKDVMSRSFVFIFKDALDQITDKCISQKKGWVLK
jgi:ribosomal protein L4